MSMNERTAIKNLIPYEVKDETYVVKLDANESMDYVALESFDISGMELYPDPESKTLRKALSKDLGVGDRFITMGNGSSELLDLLFKAYLSKGDVVLSFDPSFSMYEIYAKIYEANFIKVPSREDYFLDMDEMIDRLDLNPKIILLCTPNNPTGYQIPKQDMLRLLRKTNALVIVDEAYMEFSNTGESMMDKIETYENLVVLRTFSKAYGLAGARLGYMISNDQVTEVIKKVRSPYHVNALSQRLGLIALSKKETIFQSVEKIKKTRAFFKEALEKLGFVVYPSEGNFLFVSTVIKDLGERLKEKGVLIRAFKINQNMFYRITIRKQIDMALCLAKIKEIIDENE